MAWLPPFLHPAPLLLPTAGGESRLSQMYTCKHACTHTHTCIPVRIHTHTKGTQANLSLIQFFFFLSSSSPLFCFSPDKPLFHIVALGAGGQPLFTSTSHLIRALYQPEGKRCGLKLRKPAGCQQTSICKLGLRNMCLLTKRKASGGHVFHWISVCVCMKNRTSFV